VRELGDTRGIAARQAHDIEVAGDTRVLHGTPVSGDKPSPVRGSCS
jgi:hypothetical protein